MIKSHKIGNSEVFLQDCVEGMKRFPDGYFDLACVDPPYGININMNAGRKKDTRSAKRQIKHWDNTPPNADYFKELLRVSKHQIIFGSNHFTQHLPSSAGWIFWDKCVAEKCSFSDGELAYSSFERALKKAVIPYSGFIGMEGEKFHPTTKPIKLYDWIYKNYATEGMKILDTHLGSQSNRISAEKNKMIFTAFETDEDYFNQGNKRYEDFKKQLTIF